MPLPSQKELAAAKAKGMSSYGEDLNRRLENLPGQPEDLRKVFAGGANATGSSWKLKNFDVAFWDCAEPYLRLDSDGDHIADWTVVMDGGVVSPTLIPHDEDLDNDGADNLFDPHPLIPQNEIPTLGFPRHLVSRHSEIRAYQEDLLNRHGVVVLDHSDDHAASVLENFKLLLDDGLPHGFIDRISGLKSFYAFAGHDAYDDLAAYHRQMRAISIGGKLSYADSLRDSRRADLLKTLSHELGHAAIFDLVTADELKRFSSAHAGWGGVFDSRLLGGLLGESFFRPFPGPQRRHLASHYSGNNLHEWFAETFSHLVLQQLAEKKKISETLVRRLRLKKAPKIVESWLESRIGISAR